MLQPAKRVFKRTDPKMLALIRAVGPLGLEPKARIDPWTALSRAIIHQQLSTKAAGTIYERVRALTPGARFPTPVEMLALPDERLRGAGLSRGKASYLKDLAARVVAKSLPTTRKIRTMTDQEIIDALVAVKGVGQWSVEMYLIFTLGRPDVLPVDDLGVRKGFAKIYGLEELPTKQELYDFGERWRPFRSVASWYLWRALDSL